MKTTLFTAGQVMACLMLLSPGAFAEEYHKDVSAVFHLKAMYKDVTCQSALAASGDISGTTIDFGTFSSDSKDITKKVVLTLTCDSDLPDTVKVGFSVLSPAKVDADNNSRLYPSGTDGKQQTNLYYDWVWGDKINNTVKQSVGDSAHKTVKPNDGVDLSGASSADVYEIVSQSNGGKSLNFPLDITRKVKETSQLAAGDYTADVTVTISYD
ncbi:hypothetical protein CBX60_23465 [Salmonella enterica subsp. enterica serovar Pensacola]|nr:hypothetical protein [Salmonella enterica]ECT8867503.1 hypothetical protein [Salmonella enterica subsp. enterica serovar Pensacola]